jgi:hypothetical protein
LRQKNPCLKSKLEDFRKDCSRLDEDRVVLDKKTLELSSDRKKLDEEREGFASSSIKRTKEYEAREMVLKDKLNEIEKTKKGA